MSMVETSRGLVRTVVTLTLVGTMCGCVILFAVTGAKEALEAASFIGAPAGFVINAWFEARRQERANGG